MNLGFNLDSVVYDYRIALKLKKRQSFWTMPQLLNICGNSSGSSNRTHCKNYWV
ncbi:hypothetical protein D3C74_350230 [compost metagenome]